MNYSEIVSKLLLSIRRNHSTLELSKSMGYKFNQVKRWESGEKQLRWDEFCHYCEVLNLPIFQILKNIFYFDSADLKSQNFIYHLHNLYPLYSAVDLAKKLNRHSSAIKRYISGEIFPDLEFVFAFMDLDSNRLSKFIHAIIPTDQESLLRTHFKLNSKHVDLEEEIPLSPAIECWLATQTYQALENHDDQFIAERVGCSSEEVNRILTIMTDLGIVVKNDNGKYSTVYNIIDTSGNIQLACKMSKFWIRRTTLEGSAINLDPVKNLITYRIASASKECMRQINEVLIRADAEIGSILKNDINPADGVRVILLHAFNTQDFE